MEIIEIKDGKHSGESGVVIKISKDGIKEVLTLEGDIHYYNQGNFEVKCIES